MGLPIISAIAAHKLVAVLLVASLGVSGGAVAVSSNGHLSNVVGELSFVIKPSITNVTQVASLNLGTLVAGETGTQSSTAVVNFTTAGTYELQLEGLPVLQQVFTVFNVTVTTPSVTSTTQILLSLQHTSAPIVVSSAGPESLVVSLIYAVNNGPGIQRGITVSNAAFLDVEPGPVPVPVPQTGTTQTTGNGQS